MIFFNCILDNLLKYLIQDIHKGWKLFIYVLFVNEFVGKFVDGFTNGLTCNMFKYWPLANINYLYFTNIIGYKQFIKQITILQEFKKENKKPFVHLLILDH